MIGRFAQVLFLVFLAVAVARPQAKPDAAPADPTTIATSASPATPVTIAAKTAGLEKLPGYVPLYWDARAGKLWLEINEWRTEFLYVNSLSAGVGSNDIGLDRGQLGGTRVVRWERSGPKVLLTESNYGYRASGENADERRTVRESFAESILWGFEVAGEDQGRVLVDATNFFLRDAHDVTGTLRRTHQGTFRLDASRCAIYLPRTKNFPLNTEVEATLTFEGDEPGEWLQQVVPTPQAVTVREHHSFVKLPAPGYKMRRFDPRAGRSGEGRSAPAAHVLSAPFIERPRRDLARSAARGAHPFSRAPQRLGRAAPRPERERGLER